MTITNHAVGESINLATTLNTKLEAPVLQHEMGLDAVASASGNAVRWNEFSLKHNNDGSFKGIDQGDMKLTTSGSATQKPIRYDEFSLKHNADGSFKGIDQADMKLTTSATATQKPIRWDEFSVKHNNDGTFKNPIQMYKKFPSANPSATANTYGTATILTPATNYNYIVPQAIDVVLGGTFTSGESVTGRVTSTYSDTTTTIVTKSGTATGTISFTNTDLMGLVKDGVNITKLQFDSQSTSGNTTVSCTFNHYGYFI
jgi:hypothetical protein